MKPCPGPIRATKKPAFTVPPNSCDTHAHVFGPQAVFPFSAQRSYTPEDCTLEDYRQMLATLGFDRGVIVHGGAHGTDNRVTLNALEQLGPQFRAILVQPPGLSLAERKAQHALGVRGYRMSTVVSGGVGFDLLQPLAEEAAELDWHVLLHFHHAHELLDVESTLKDLPCPFVLDHLARIEGRQGITDPAFSAVLRLLDTGKAWVKLASLYRLSSEPYPHKDMLPMIHQVIESHPDRVLWGSNWPHPIHEGPMPNDGDLVDLIPLWAPNPAHQQQLLVSNPATLYGYA